jgi:Na+-transporting methylmalonyl-CoA/oxaloacetate decarboxylase beta subunit
MIKNFDDLSKLVNEYQIKRLTMSDKFFDSLIVTQLSDTTMNEMINKFETMMLSLQTATKKIEFFMQNMTASVLMLNVYISHELVTSAHSTMSMLSSFSLLKSE